MKLTILSLCFLLSHVAFSQVDQKLADRKWAYYGEEFYQKAAKGQLDKASVTKILNGKHSSSQGKFDSISANCSGSCYQHVSVGYDSARVFLFGQIYTLEDAQGTYVKDVYCGKNFHFKRAEDADNMHQDVNIEHTWPQSKFTGRYERGMQKSDMHHLYLADSKANSQRGNFDFADLTNTANELNVDNCPDSVLGRNGGRMAFMPPATHRGNLARALFYFASHYELDIDSATEKTLRAWSKSDPVDANEIARHEMIAKIQKVRNPFVDHPEFIDQVADF